MSLPLVSCIMPTRNRRAFVSQAIKYFLRQDYPNRELVVADDGDDAVYDLIDSYAVVATSAVVRYRRVKPGQTLGSKRNALVEVCMGDLIMHWDDDDWYGPERISRQVEALENAGAGICGLPEFLIHDLPTSTTYRYKCAYRPYLYCATLLYTRAFWEALPFPDMQVGSATPFLWPESDPHRLDGAVFMHDDLSWFVGMSHLDNTSPKAFGDPAFFPWHEGDIQEIIGDDWRFYEGLKVNLSVRKAGAPHGGLMDPNQAGVA